MYTSLIKSLWLFVNSKLLAFLIVEANFEPPLYKRCIAIGGIPFSPNFRIGTAMNT